MSVEAIMQRVKLEPGWKAALAPEFLSPYMQQLRSFLADERKSQTVYPPPTEIFAALDATPLANVRVVILGQDPYHGAGQAHGLCFSVRSGVPLPPSLINIYKEISADLGCRMPSSGDLTPWAKQGVLLLNAVLTVRANQAASHQGKGWETFTDAIVREVNERCEHVVFLLWGSYAQKKGAHIDTRKHLVLKAPHPSPLSAHRGFLGCRHFSKANAWLAQQGLQPIDWCMQSPDDSAAN